MTDLRTAAQQALEALEATSSYDIPAPRLRRRSAITALRAALVEPVQEPGAWTPVAEALPNSGVKVLACYRNRLGNLRRIRAMWTAAKTEEADSDDAEACSEYDEATDTYYVTEGWYECIDNWGDYSSVAVTEGEVTHWMLLPPDPSTAPPQQEALKSALAEPVQDTAFDRWWDNALDGPTPVAPVSKETARWIWNAAKAEPVQEPAAQAEPEPMSPERRQRWEELAAMPRQADPQKPVADYERGFVDGMSEQARRSVDRAVNAMVSSKAKPLSEEELEVLAKKHNGIFYDCDIHFARAIEAAHGIEEGT